MQNTFQIGLPYPADEPANVLVPGRIYDIEEWRAWFGDLGFDIEDIYRVEFLDDSRCTVFMYRTSPGHRRLLDGDDIAVVDPITVEYVTPPPTYT